MGFVLWSISEKYLWVGAILFLTENHSFELMTGLGEGSNNFAELLSLKLLLIFAVDKGCRSLKVYGDLLNVINWIKRIQHCRDLRLENILLSILAVIDSYDSFTCEHVYRENNLQEKIASKARLKLATGQWKIKERIDNTFYE